MPRVFDNIKTRLLPAIENSLKNSNRADFCIGYFSLRGWRSVAGLVDDFSGGKDASCRILIGMQRLPEDEVFRELSLTGDPNRIDNSLVNRFKKELAESFRKQIVAGTPTNQDEATLRKLAEQIRSEKVVVKLHLKHLLHAKLYLLFRDDADNPRTGYVGSSNLTLAGLSRQGELNLDAVDQDTTAKLAQWFEDRWNDHWTVDISTELAEIIEQSWAREDLIPPHQIYLKMAYHLAQEARSGIAEFKIPREFGDEMFDYQIAAVKIAAHHASRRRGVLMGDCELMAGAIIEMVSDRVLAQEYVELANKGLDRFTPSQSYSSYTALIEDIRDE